MAETIGKEAEIDHSPIFCAIAAICFGSAVQAGDVVVTAQGLRNTQGMLRVAVCGEADFLEPSCPFAASAPAADGRVRVRDVPPGNYAIQAFHDENGDGVLDRTRLGRPAEGMGFSRDAPMRFGPPSYADAAVVVPAGGGQLTVMMRYFR